jgi:glycolate oxidase FAD binding subunit
MTGRSLSDVISADTIREVGTDVEWARPGARPETVIRPTSAAEVAAVLRWADSEGVGVLPIGEGDRVAPVASGRFVALSTERLSGIEIYEPADLTFTAGAGTAISTIVEALSPHDQWMPFDPPDVSRRSLGGLVALGESGPLWAGYGALRNHVLGMTIATGDGRVLRLGGRVVKNVAGFDLLKPMVASISSSRWWEVVAASG